MERTAEFDELLARVAEAVETTVQRHQTRSRAEEVIPAKTAEKWLTNRDVMRMLGVSRATLQRYRSKGLLPYSKIGGKVYYTAKDLERALCGHGKQP